MSCTGNKNLLTPAMDSLADDGMLFEKAYCTFPLCTPSRGSMFTGRMPHELDIMMNGRQIPDEFIPQSMGHLFKQEGYDCAYGGKWHVPTINIPNETYGFRNICGIEDNELPERCIEFLETPRDNPFLLVASFDNPHNIVEWERNEFLPWGPVVDRSDDECPLLPPNTPIPPYEPELIKGFRAKSKEYSDRDWAHYRNAYFRLVEKVDEQIGKIIECLKRTGQYENTVIVFSSDHGEMNGSHRLKQKRVLYEESIRVPFIICYKGHIPENTVNDWLPISNGLSLLPTVCEYAGIAVPDNLIGKSLKPIIESKKQEGIQDYTVVQTWLGEDFRLEGRAVISSKYKYVIYRTGEYREQLFDLDADCGEMVNLAPHKDYMDLLCQHRNYLYEWCLETGDHFGRHYAYNKKDKPIVPGYEYL